MCKRTSSDPLVRLILDRYRVNLLSVPRRRADCGQVYIRNGRRVSPGVDIRWLVEPAVELPPVYEDEPLADLAASMSDAVRAKIGLGLLESFLAAIGAGALGPRIGAHYENRGTARLRFRITDARMDSVDPGSLGLALAGRRLRDDQPLVRKGNDYFITTGVVRSPSISVVAEDERGRVIDLAAEVTAIVDGQAGISSQVTGAAEVTYTGAEPLAVGLQLCELRMRDDGRVEMLPQDPEDGVQLGRTEAPRPVFVGAGEEALLELEPDQPDELLDIIAGRDLGPRVGSNGGGGVIDIDDGGRDDGADEPHVNAWIGEHEATGPRALVAGDHYTLRLSVGRRVLTSLVDGPQARLSRADIPDEGLPTRWTVSTRDAALAARSDAVTVNDVQLRDATWAISRFELDVPRRGDSEIVELDLTPAASPVTHLDIAIDARGERYRELSLDLSVVPAPRNPTEAEPIVVDEQVVVPAAHLGVHPPHEWQTPPVRLRLSVGRGRRVAAAGTVRHDGAILAVDDDLDWPVVPTDVAGLILNVRKSAEALRAKRETYFDAIGEDDLAQRLSRFTPTYNWATAPDRADDEHRDAWREVATSDELRALAYDGRQLYTRFFPDGAPLRAWVDELQPGDRLDLAWTSSADDVVPGVPWGLMYAAELPGPQEPVDPMGFLGLRQRLAYRAHRTAGPFSRALGAPDKAYRAHLLYWGDQTDDRAGVEARWQQTAWGGEPNHTFVPVSPGPDAKARLLEALKQPVPRPATVLYLYCRCEVGDGSQVTLRFGSGMSAGDLVQRFDLPDTPLEDRPLVFANACTTLASNPYYSNELERGFVERGARAFVGTEVYVPVTLASRLAAIYFHFLGRHADPAPMAAGEALAQTRLFLWTEFRNIGGLFYTHINEYDVYLADDAEVVRLTRS